MKVRDLWAWFSRSRNGKVAPAPQAPQAPLPAVKKSHAPSFPLGISFDERGFQIVLVRKDRTITHVGGPHHDDLGGAIRAALDAQHITERRAVFAIPAEAGLIAARDFPVLFTFRECMANVATGPDDPRFEGTNPADLAVVLSLDRKKKDKASLRHGNYAVARKAQVEEYRAIATAAGLRLEALDYEGFAWKRALHGAADAVLSLSPSTATLVVFTPDLFHCSAFDRTRGADWMDRVSETLRTLRVESNSAIDPRTMALFSDERDPHTIETLETNGRVRVVFWEVTDPVDRILVKSPPWAIAYGLALCDADAEALLA